MIARTMRGLIATTYDRQIEQAINRFSSRLIWKPEVEGVDDAKPFETEERRAFHDVARFMESEIWPHVDDWDEAGSYLHEINERSRTWRVRL